MKYYTLYVIRKYVIIYTYVLFELKAFNLYETLDCSCNLCLMFA